MKNIFFISLVFLYSCKYTNPLRDFPEKVLRAFETVNYQPPLPKSALQIITPKEVPVIHQDTKGVIPIKKKILSRYYSKDDVFLKATNLPKGSKFDPKTGEFTWTPLSEHLTDFPLGSKQKQYSFEVSLLTKKEPVIGVTKKIYFLVEKKFYSPEILSIEEVNEDGTPVKVSNNKNIGQYFLFERESLNLRISVRDRSMESPDVNPSFLRFYSSTTSIEFSTYLSNFSVSVGKPKRDKVYKDIWHYKASISWNSFLLQELILKSNLRDTIAYKNKFHNKLVNVAVQSYRGKLSKKEVISLFLVRKPAAPNIIFLRKKHALYKGVKNVLHIPIISFSNSYQTKVSLGGICQQKYDFARKKFEDLSVRKKNTKFQFRKERFPGHVHCYCRPLSSETNGDTVLAKKMQAPKIIPSLLANMPANAGHLKKKKQTKNFSTEYKEKQKTKTNLILCEIEAQIVDNYEVLSNSANMFNLRVEASTYYMKGSVDDIIYEKYKGEENNVYSKTSAEFIFVILDKKDNPSSEEIAKIYEDLTKNQLDQLEKEKQDLKQDPKNELSQNILGFKPSSFVKKAQADLKQVESFFSYYKPSSIIQYFKSFFKSPPSYSHYRSYVSYFSFFSSSYYKAVLGDKEEVKDLKRQTERISQKARESLEKDSFAKQSLMKNIFYIGVLDALGFYLDFLRSIDKDKRKLDFNLILLELSGLNEEVFGFSYQNFFDTKEFEELLDQLKKSESFYKQSDLLRKLKTKYLIKSKKEKSKSKFINIFDEGSVF